VTSPHHRKLKILILDIGGTEYQIQCRKAQVVNNTDDGENFYTFGNNGSNDSTGFVEPADPAWALDLGFYSDWQLAGINDYLWDNDGETVTFSLELYPDIPAEHVIFTGEVVIKAPSAGGEVRAQDVTEMVLQCPNKPAKSRP
jgi:hypothetical protein